MKKRPDGRYVETITIDGKKKWFYGKTKAEVKSKMMAFRAEQEQGLLFPVVADEWWELAEPTLANNSIKCYRPAYVRAKNNFKDFRISAILPSDVNKAVVRFSRTSADKTTRTQLMIYNLIFKYAVNMGYIPFNPAREITVPKNLPKKKVSMPSDEDIERVKNSIDCTFGLFAYMALYTGLRRGELLALEWKDIDLENRLIRVNKSLEYIGSVPHVKEPKTSSGVRTVPILDALSIVLQRKKGIVFPNAYGTYITDSQFILYWTKYKKEAGIDCTPHQLRHAFATMLYENQDKIPIKVASQILGHAQISTTADIYADIRSIYQDEIYGTIREIDLKK